LSYNGDVKLIYIFVEAMMYRNYYFFWPKLDKNKSAFI